MMKRNNSRLAAKMLTDTDNARKALASNNKDQALKAVDDGLERANRLEASRQGRSNVIPIYTEWESASVIAPIMAEKNQNHRNDQNNQNNQQSTSAQNQAQPQRQGTASREANPQEAEAVRGVAGGFTSITVDAKMADEHLKAAQSALEQNDLKTADSALAAVQDSVALTRFASDMPLMQTRDDLAIASRAVRNGNYTEASGALRAAAHGLDQYANGFAGSNAGNVEQLRNKISSCADQIESNHSNAESRIQNWWNEVTTWTHPSSSNSANTSQQSQSQQNQSQQNQ